MSSSDNGVYSCRARNVAGQIESVDNFLLNIPGLYNCLTFIYLFLISINLFSIYLQFVMLK